MSTMRGKNVIRIQKAIEEGGLSALTFSGDGFLRRQATICGENRVLVVTRLEGKTPRFFRALAAMMSLPLTSLLIL